MFHLKHSVLFAIQLLNRFFARSKSIKKVIGLTGHNIECPDCGDSKAIESLPELGELVTCGCCGLLMEVLSQSPFSVGKAPQVEEDFGE